MECLLGAKFLLLSVPIAEGTWSLPLDGEGDVCCDLRLLEGEVVELSSETKKETILLARAANPELTMAHVISSALTYVYWLVFVRLSLKVKK